MLQRGWQEKLEPASTPEFLCLCLSTLKYSSIQQRGLSLSWFPLACGRWDTAEVLYHPQLRSTGYFLTWQWPLAACPHWLWAKEPEPALLGCSITERENTVVSVKAPPCLARAGCPLPVFLALWQLNYGSLALTTGGKTQSGLHSCWLWWKGLNNASVSSSHLSGEINTLCLLNCTRLGSHLMGLSLSVSTQVSPCRFMPFTPSRPPLRNTNAKIKLYPWPLPLTFRPLPFPCTWPVCSGLASWLTRLAEISALKRHLNRMWFSWTHKYRHKMSALPVLGCSLWSAGNKCCPGGF